jgi:hypothetical protein
MVSSFATWEAGAPRLRAIRCRFTFTTTPVSRCKLSGYVCRDEGSCYHTHRPRVRRRAILCATQVRHAHNTMGMPNWFHMESSDDNITWTKPEHWVGAQNVRSALSPTTWPAPHISRGDTRCTVQLVVATDTAAPSLLVVGVRRRAHHVRPLRLLTIGRAREPKVGRHVCDCKVLQPRVQIDQTLSSDCLRDYRFAAASFNPA